MPINNERNVNALIAATQGKRIKEAVKIDKTFYDDNPSKESEIIKKNSDHQDIDYRYSPEEIAAAAVPSASVYATPSDPSVYDTTSAVASASVSATPSSATAGRRIRAEKSFYISDTDLSERLPSANNPSSKKDTRTTSR